MVECYDNGGEYLYREIIDDMRIMCNNGDVGQIEVACVSGDDHTTIQNYYTHGFNGCIPIGMEYIHEKVSASTADISYSTIVILLGTGVHIYCFDSLLVN